MVRKLIRRIWKTKKERPPRLVRLQKKLDQLAKTSIDLDVLLTKVRRLVFDNNPAQYEAVRKYNIKRRILNRQSEKISRLLKAERSKGAA